MAEEAPIPTLTFEQVHAGNAATHAAHSNATKDEVLSAIRGSSQSAVDMVRGLSDAQLDRQVELLAGMPMTIEQVVEFLMVGHPDDHRQSIAKAR
jgi:hypothetical protein